MTQLLSDKVAYVTGAGSGLGRAAAERFAEAGARIAVLDRDEEAARATAQDIGGGAVGLRCDVSSVDEVRRAFAAAADAIGEPDALVNNAGIREINDVLSIEPADWDRVIAVNLNGVFYCAQTAARSMAERGGGSITNIASVAGLAAVPRRPAYSAAKSGVIGLTRSMATDLGEHGIRTNVVCPGLIRTPLTHSYFEDEAFAQGIGQIIPHGRPGEPSEVADLLVYLASDMASYVSGAAIAIDGGFIAGKGFEPTGAAADSKFAATRSVK